MKSAFLMLVTCALSLGIGACGGDGGSSNSSAPTKNFIASADQICTEQAQKINQVSGYGARTVPKIQAYISKLIPVHEEWINRLTKLSAPEDVSSDFDQFVSAREEYLALLQQGESALANNDATAYKNIGSQFATSTQQANQAAGRVGLNACANGGEAAQEEQPAKRQPTFGGSEHVAQP